MCNGHGWAYECKAALAQCQTAVFGQVLLASAGVNVYDIRKRCIEPLCYPQFAKLAKYLEQPEVRKALGVGEIRWSACDSKVHADMMGDWMLEYDSILPDMLDDGVEVMVYAGEKDLICNWLGNRRWVDAMDWQGTKKWSDADDFEWSVEGSSAGLVAEAGPLTFVKVYNAGHMVPMDQGKNALDMISRFTSGKSFQEDSVAREQSISDRREDSVTDAPAHGGKLPGWRSSVQRLRAQHETVQKSAYRRSHDDRRAAFVFLLHACAMAHQAVNSVACGIRLLPDNAQICVSCRIIFVQIAFFCAIMRLFGNLYGVQSSS
eukprot:TRINITY_DN6900_c3_g1_i3.p1 TRINITY_DN6900_c3_g1~~TRINITY_DN6900_c3_g1_i3.p1  ORF type:complete len:319 (-),score=33.08 TRINITY_DN6900_c3_g1_i3:89-1045(-)